MSMRTYDTDQERFWAEEYADECIRKDSHIHPRDLLANMATMFDDSRRYALPGESFNRTPVSIAYQGQQNRLFKSDCGKLFIENFPVKLVDYGFLRGHIYDSAGFDDVTWWLFEKV